MLTNRRTVIALTAFALTTSRGLLHAGGERRIITVGPGRALTTPAAAAAIAGAGDVVEIEAGTYGGGVAVWSSDNVVIRGVGGPVQLRGEGAQVEGKAIWVIKGRNVVVENIAFLGARVRDGNGAGIRHEGAGLTIRRCVFRNNETGILTGSHPESDIRIEDSEFAHNGAGDGQTHNIYVGGGRSFTLRGSSIHHARVGHNVKNRARIAWISYNRIMDEDDGASSYAVDLPNGGVAVLVGNVIQQGPNTHNATLAAYGAEGLRHSVNELYAVSNTFVNDRRGGGTFLHARGTPTIVHVVNNVFAGPGTVLRGAGRPGPNIVTADPGFVDRREHNYHLTRRSPAINAGHDPGTAYGVSLVPVEHFVLPVGTSPRRSTGRLDMGAYQYGGGEARSTVIRHVVTREDNSSGARDRSPSHKVAGSG